jgi:microcystin-dependent protein
VSDYFLGEIRMFPWNWAPKGWALCNGALLAINQNQALFSLLGTTYGGDGRTTFALPNLKGRTPVGQGISPVSAATYPLGEVGGAETVTLLPSTMAMHTHVMTGANDAATIPAPGTNYLAQPVVSLTDPTPVNLYSTPTSLTPLDPAAVSATGGSGPHSNMQPYLVMNYCIATAGIFPSRN